MARDVWVARGKVSGDRSPGTQREKPILIYGIAAPTDPVRTGGWADLFHSMSEYIGGPVIAADVSSSQTIYFAVHATGSPIRWLKVTSSKGLLNRPD